MGSAKALVDRLWEAHEVGDNTAIRELFAPSVEIVMPGGMRLQGAEQLVAFLQMYREAFPDMRHRTVNYVESENKIAVELRITGTHTGPMRMPTGEIPPTGRAVVWESVDLITFAGNRISTWHTYFDQMTFLSQLGLLPAPVAA